MRLGATGQRGETPAGARCSPRSGAARRTPTPSGPTSCSRRFLLDTKREDFAGSLSGGQRKLLEMARALMVDPELVMLDEPMAGVNPALKQSLLGHVKSLRDEGMTVLFVEHDMDMVRDISDWVIVMAQGKIDRRGPAGRRDGRPARDRRLPRRPPRHQAHLIEAWRSRSSPRREAETRGARRAHGHGARSDVTTDAATDAEHRATPSREAHLAGRRGRRPARRRPDRRLPARGQHPQRRRPLLPARASSSASSAPTAPASRRCSRRCSGWSRSAPARCSSRARTSPTSAPTCWSPRASASSRRPTTSSRR